MKFLVVVCLIVPLLAAPQTQNRPQLTKEQQQMLEQGPPAECEKPFGDGTLSKAKSPYSFTVTAKQRQETSDYKKTFKGAPLDLTINFAAAPGTSNIRGFALRAGIPFPVVQWKNTGDKQVQVASCIAPQSIDTLIVKGQIGAKYSVVATPLLAAWANQDSLAVIYEMAIQGGDGSIHVANFNGTIKVKETDYVLPAQFFQPPQGQGQGAQGPAQGMRGPQQGGQFSGQGQFGGQRQRREAGDLNDLEIAIN
jgi:hypothetical protein